MGIIVALDIGISSVGWAVVDNEKETVLESGSNLFSEAAPASNVQRRSLRQARRLKRRLKTRIDDFKKLWETSGLKTSDASEIDIAALKVKALSEEITLDQLYSVLYSELKHRGISYLDDAEDAEGDTEYAEALAKNQQELKTKYPCQIQLERLNNYGKYRGNNKIINEDGTEQNINNVFTTSAYRNEVTAILQKQQEYHGVITDELIDGYLLIFNRKRKYYEGPGNELSRTDYGIYTTKIDPETGKYITDLNLFEKLVGKGCAYGKSSTAV